MANGETAGPGGGSTTLWAGWKGNGKGGLRNPPELVEGAIIIDSQSVKTAGAGGVRGYDAGKKVKGRKRRIAADTLGNLLAVVAHAANIQDRDGARLLLEQLRAQGKSGVKLIWADGAYRGRLVAWARDKLDRPAGDSAASCPEQGVRGVAPEVGGGAHPGLAKPLPKVEQGL